MYRIALLLIAASLIITGCDSNPTVEEVTDAQNLFIYMDPGQACRDHYDGDVDIFAVTQNFDHTLEVFCIGANSNLFVIEQSLHQKQVPPTRRVLGKLDPNRGLDEPGTNPHVESCKKYGMFNTGTVHIISPISLGMGSFNGRRNMPVCIDRATGRMIMLEPRATGKSYGPIWRTWRNVRFYPDLPPQE